MLSRQEEEAERRATLENDLKVLEQQRGSTFHQHGVSQASELSGGRFAATGSPRVIGSTASVAAQYPAASGAHQTELPLEPPLGYSIEDMTGLENPADSSSSVSLSAGTGGAAAPSATSDVEPAPSSSSLDGPDGFISQPTTVRGERAGPSSFSAGKREGRR